MKAAVMELSAYLFETLREDGEFLLHRGQQRSRIDGVLPPILVVEPVGEHPAPGSLRRLEHEYALRAELAPGWAVRPLALAQHQGRTLLVLEDPGGEPLDRLLGQPMEVGRFLRLAIGIALALSKVHQRGLIHKDLKPANVLVHRATGRVWLMGFGIASRLPRERQAPGPPEVIAGTLAYMAPEQTGRMNRSIDARSDLYALGVTLYELLTGPPPSTAAEPLEWVHCHIARQPVPPAERCTEVPGAVSALIMKLLAKTAEERYQTAAGVAHDLRRCLAQWEGEGRIDAFPLGAHDTPDRLLIPEKLYGRAREIAILLAGVERVVTGGARRSWCWCPAIPGLASPRSSTSCTKCWCRRAACSRRANSTSTSVTSRMRRWRRRCRVCSVRSWGRATRSWAAGVMPSGRRWVRTGSSWWIWSPN